jgi:hypothetical protein
MKGMGILPLGPGIQHTSGIVDVNLPFDPEWTMLNPFAETVGFAMVSPGLELDIRCPIIV